MRLIVNKFYIMLSYEHQPLFLSLDAMLLAS